MLDDKEILNIIGDELGASAGGNENEFIDSNRKDALAYYLGQKQGTEVEGRSSVVSTDVADAVEWIMPEIMEQLSKFDEIVTFDPESAEDEDQAAMESRFVYDILMKENDGFLILHQVIKDALLQKNGITKTWFDVDIERCVKRFTGLSEQEYQYIAEDERYEIAELSTEVDHDSTNALMEQYEQMVQQIQMQAQQSMAQGMNPPSPQLPPEPEPVLLYSIKTVVEIDRPRIKVCAVPPEEFRINRQHNTPNPKDARFTAHVMMKSASDLVKSGIPKEVVEALPRGEIDEDRDYRFYMQDETVYPTREVSNDKSQNLIEVAECYLHIDIDEDGIAEFVKIEVAGGDNPTDILRMEEISVDDHPFSSAIAIMMSHKFFGLSIYDRLKELQDQKTALWRNIFDNLYLQNNQRTAVLEGQVNLDDLLISRPGGIIRQRVPGAVEPIMTPSIGQDAYQMMEYLDQVRAGRVGVNPEGPLNLQDIGDRVGSQGVAQLMAAREAVVGLIIRVIAETGIKPTMTMIRNQARQHLDAVQNFKFRDSWRAIRPTDWPSRNNTTVHVGTGSGNNTSQLMAVSQILEYQNVVKQDPGQTLVTQESQFSALKKFCVLSGLGSPDAYFIDPRSDNGQELSQQQQQHQQKMKQEQDQKDMALIQMQTKLADAEVQKAQAEMANVQLKAQIGQMTLQIDEAETIASNASKNAESEFKYRELESKEAIEISKIESKERIEISKAHQQNKAAVENGGA